MMQSLRKEVAKIINNDNNISFSSEVAETLGIECALILSQYKDDKLDDISSSEGILSSTKKVLGFIDEKKIKDSINTLIKFGLIELKEIKKNKKYELRSPQKSYESSKLSNKWIPSIEVNEIIEMTDITPEFFDLKLKEFKIYWIERGQKKNNWNSSFIEFIRREWAKEINSKQVMPHIIDENWYPDEEVFDILNLSEITKDSALIYLKEFILYWKDKGTAFTTWNSKFIDHVKRRHIINNRLNNSNEENKKYSEPGQYKQDFKTRKNDNTWAKEINFD